MTVPEALEELRRVTEKYLSLEQELREARMAMDLAQRQLLALARVLERQDQVHDARKKCRGSGYNQ